MGKEVSLQDLSCTQIPKMKGATVHPVPNLDFEKAKDLYDLKRNQSIQLRL
jgi:hypothetical protein